MRIVDFLVLFFGTSMTLVNVNGKPAGNNRGIPLPGTIRVKKRNEDSSSDYFLEQCGIVKFPNVQRGVVNVLAFLDSSWPYSHRQAIMLKMLKGRLQKSGLPDTIFFVVNINPNFSRKIDTTEDDIEREAWLGVSPDEIERFSEIDKSLDSLAKSTNPEIHLIQDNEDLGIWKELGGSRDQVLVIDRCGKLTYQVIVPWSILHFPYVKAAILSTYKDEPCGHCDAVADNNTTDGFQNKDLETSLETTGTTESDNDSVTLSDIPTIFDPGMEENVNKQTFNVPDDETTVEWSTTGEAITKSTLNFFVSPVITTQTDATARNLITEDDYSYSSMQSSTKKYEESTPPMVTIDLFNGGDSYLPEIEDDTTALSGASINEDFTVKSGTEISDSTIDYRGFAVNWVEGIAETSTVENSHSQTTKVSEIKETSIILMNEKNSPDQEDKIYTAGIIFNDTDSVINASTEKNADSQTSRDLGIGETLIDLNNNPLDQEDENDKSGITFNSTDATIEETSEENLLSQATKALGIDEKSMDLMKKKSPLNQDKNKTIYNDFFESQVTDSSDLSSGTSQGVFETISEEVSDFQDQEEKDQGITISSINFNVTNSTKPNDLDTTNESRATSPDIIDRTTSMTSKKTSDLSRTFDFEIDLTGSKMETASLDPVVDLIDYDAKDVNYGTTNNYEATSPNTTDKIADKATGIIFDFSATQAVHVGDKFVATKMEDTSLHATSDYEATSPRTMANFIRTSKKDILESITPRPFTTKEETLKNDDSRITQDLPNESKEIEDYKASSYMPIRIIMHAPHFHADGDSTRMHEYLVLKTGSSRNHGHLASHDATRLYRGPQDYQEKISNFTIEEIEKKEWSMKNLIYNKDESTGLFGEVADYWRDVGSLENYEDADETERPDPEGIHEEDAVDEKLWKQPSKGNNEKLTSVETGENLKGPMETTERLQAAAAAITSEMVTEIQPMNGADEFNSEEDETRNKLIAHYSKLLPWIYYVLDK